MTARLLALHALILSVVLGVALSAVVADFSSHYERTLKRDLGEELAEFQTAANARGRSVALSTFVTSYLRSHALPSGRVLLIAIDHHTPEGSQGSDVLFSSRVVTGWLATNPASTAMTTTSGAHPYLVIASPIQEGGATIGVFLAGVDLAGLAQQRHQVLLLAGSEAAIALLVALLTTYLLLRRVLGAVSRVTATAEEISRGALDRRLGYERSDDEVGRLARTFDDMLGRLSSALTSQRQLLSDVSHQLRTPLTVARGHLEVLGRGDCSDSEEVRDTLSVVIEEIDHMRVLTDRLLLLGRSLEPDFIDAAPVDLRSLMADLADAAKVLADRRWSLSPLPDRVAFLDAQKMRGAVLNLIDNAVRATQVGDEIRLEAAYEGAALCISVSDTGRGMTAEQRNNAFARFARPGAMDSSGSGLGLAIVRAVAEGHGGQVTIESELGLGCRVTMIIPAEATVEPDGTKELRL